MKMSHENCRLANKLTSTGVYHAGIGFGCPFSCECGPTKGWSIGVGAQVHWLTMLVM